MHYSLSRHQDLINKRENIGLKEVKDPKPLTEYLNNMQDVYKNIKKSNPGRKCNILVLDDRIADIIINKKFNQVVTELVITARKVNTSTVFITQTCFSVPKDVRLDCTHFLLRKPQTDESFSKLQLILTLKTL